MKSHQSLLRRHHDDGELEAQIAAEAAKEESAILRTKTSNRTTIYNEVACIHFVSSFFCSFALFFSLLRSLVWFQAGLLQKLLEITPADLSSWAWSERLVLTSAEPILVADVDDDLKREVALFAFDYLFCLVVPLNQNIFCLLLCWFSSLLVISNLSQLSKRVWRS